VPTTTLLLALCGPYAATGAKKGKEKSLTFLHTVGERALRFAELTTYVLVRV
jgi:hypothetical protein